jgi:hypothetical protein
MTGQVDQMHAVMVSQLAGDTVEHAAMQAPAVQHDHIRATATAFNKQIHGQLNGGRGNFRK